jgi:hypothetical protein
MLKFYDTPLHLSRLLPGNNFFFLSHTRSAIETKGLLHFVPLCPGKYNWSSLNMCIVNNVAYSLVKYKGELRKDFFGKLPGVVGVHGKLQYKCNTMF